MKGYLYFSIFWGLSHRAQEKHRPKKQKKIGPLALSGPTVKILNKEIQSLF